MTAMELMLEMITGAHLVDRLDYEPGLCSNGGRYSFTYRLDPQYKLWVICSYEGSSWEQISSGLSETWNLLKGVDWSEKATWLEGPRWQIW